MQVSLVLDVRLDLLDGFIEIEGSGLVELVKVSFGPFLAENDLFVLEVLFYFVNYQVFLLSILDATFVN